MEMVIDASGSIRCIYGEDIDLACLGDVSIRRASQVEADAQAQWWADLAPVHGPRLGPFTRRSTALEAELTWLATCWLAGGSNAVTQSDA